MKLLIYTNFFLPQPGGTQTVVLDLAREFSKRTVERPGTEPIEVTVATQESRAWSEDGAQPYRIVRAPSFGELRRLIHDADLVHLAGPALTPLMLCVWARKKFVVEHHAFLVSCPNGQYYYEPQPSLCSGHFMAGNYSECVRCNSHVVGTKKALVQLPLTGLRRWLCNRAAINILPTEWLGTLLKLDRMETIHHGISDTSGNAPAISSPAAEQSTPVFAFQGRLVPTKGIRVLLDAVYKLQAAGRAFSMKIIGGGDAAELEALKAAAARSGASVEFLGHVPDAQLPAALAGVSAMIMPSLAGEVFGLVAAENMLRGKLVIVSDLGSLKEVVGDAGLVFRNGDSADLADKMKRVVDDPGLVATLGNRALNRARTAFDLDTMVERHIEIYRSVLGPGASKL
jgi:glycosyltransferase involved in cell wall biosynthesis